MQIVAEWNKPSLFLAQQLLATNKTFIFSESQSL